VSSQVPVATAPVVASIADPAPLGLAGFAMTTFVLSAFNTNVLSNTLEAAVLPLALFYGGLGQLLAGMWEFRRGNTFAATAFTSFGAFWLAFYWLVTYDAAHLAPAAEAHKAVALFLLAWAIFTAYMTVAALRVSGAVLAVFVSLTITFILLAIGNFASAANTSKDWIHIGGWFGFLTALLAWYASFAGVTNATFAKTIIPTWPLANRAVVVNRP
jgi:uncharacterized protein